MDAQSGGRGVSQGDQAGSTFEGDVAHDQLGGHVRGGTRHGGVLETEGGHVLRSPEVRQLDHPGRLPTAQGAWAPGQRAGHGAVGACCPSPVPPLPAQARPGGRKTTGAPGTALGHKSTMVVTLQIHSGILNSTTGLTRWSRDTNCSNRPARRRPGMHWKGGEVPPPPPTPRPPPRHPASAQPQSP